MGEIKDFFNNITEDNVESICVGGLIFGFVGIVYSIVAGIWGFAPIHNANWKIFATSAVIMAISGLILGAMDDGKKKKG